MKSLLVLCLIVLAGKVEARSCGNLPQKVDNKKLYAEVISRGHMDLELVVVKKEFYSAKLKITGGKGFNAQNLPTCEAPALESLKWLNINIATNSTFGYDYHTAAYKICSYDFRGNLIDSHTVCNYEVGD